MIELPPFSFRRTICSCRAAETAKHLLYFAATVRRKSLSRISCSANGSLLSAATVRRKSLSRISCSAYGSFSAAAVRRESLSRISCSAYGSFSAQSQISATNARYPSSTASHPSFISTNSGSFPPARVDRRIFFGFTGRGSTLFSFPKAATISSDWLSPFL